MVQRRNRMWYSTPMYNFLLNDTVQHKYLPILSDPTEEDSDGDDLYDGQAHYLSAQDFTMLIDPEPLLKTYFPKFGTEEYKQYTEQNYDGVEYQIKHMMSTVNRCEYTDLVSDKDWLEFNKYFNEKIIEYVYENNSALKLDLTLKLCKKSDNYAKKHTVITKDMHYFRIKLNRAPATLDEMINEINSSDLHQLLDVIPYKVWGNTPDESSKYPGDDAKTQNGQNFNNNIDAQNHRAEVEEMIA